MQTLDGDFCVASSLLQAGFSSGRFARAQERQNKPNLTANSRGESASPFISLKENIFRCANKIPPDE
jgi:hypothetical protein